MGITAKLEDERGRMLDKVEDPTNVLHRILPDASNESYYYVNCIDWYGDTVFNQLQATRFIQEWSRLEDLIRDDAARRIFEGIRRLAERVEREQHVYLKFYGD